MLYVILGILILIVSFVVALISLVYEQRKVEERTKDEEVETGLVEEDVADIVDMPEPISMPQVAVSHTAEPSALPSFSTSHDTGYEDVWWEKIQTSTASEKNIPVQNEEEESIAQIRQELAKLVHGNKSVPTSNLVDDTLKVDKDVQEVSRIDTKRRNLLMGEFSLGDIKKRD